MAPSWHASASDPLNPHKVCAAAPNTAHGGGCCRTYPSALIQQGQPRAFRAGHGCLTVPHSLLMCTAHLHGCWRIHVCIAGGLCSAACMQITALCPSAEPAQPQGGAAADGEAEQHQPPQHAGPGQPAAVDHRPTFPHLAVLDLSHCAGLLGRPAKLQLDDMQAALPSLRVLKLTGLGGLYGESCCRCCCRATGSRLQRHCVKPLLAQDGGDRRADFLLCRGQTCARVTLP